MLFQAIHDIVGNAVAFFLGQFLAKSPPWTVEELDAAFVVTDSAGQAGLCLFRG